MGLMSALNIAVSGLRTTQAGMGLVSQNIANADTAGYTRRRMSTIEVVSGGQASGVRAGNVQRMLDVIAQKQLFLENAGAGYTSMLSRYAVEVDRLFGQPGTSGSLDAAVNNFTQSLQQLLSDPGIHARRAAVLDSAGVLASRISSISNSIQALRSDAETRIASAVERANGLLEGIADLNAKILSNTSAPSPALLDERDRMIGELSKLMDVQVTNNPNGSVTLATTGGMALFSGLSPVKLTFDGRGSLTPHSTYSTDADQRGVGTIRAVTGNGVPFDLVANKMIRSGEIAAALEMRDTTLVEAQRQLDELAAGLARALSDRPATVSNVTGGFNIDLTGLQAGNVVTLDVMIGGTQRRIAIVPTNGQAPANIPPSALSDPSVTVIRWDISGGINSAAAGSLQSALSNAGVNINVSSPESGKLQFVNGTNTVRGVSASITVTGLTDGYPQLPFFVDGGNNFAPFTGSFEGGSQLTGFAQRLAINPALKSDPSRLVVYNTSPPTPQGDTTRVQHILDSLTKGSYTFSASARVGGINRPLTTSVTDFASRIIEAQGAKAETAKRLDEGQKVALAAIESRFAETAAVNIDEEMAQLVQLQTAYGANARVMTAVRELMDVLLRI